MKELVRDIINIYLIALVTACGPMVDIRYEPHSKRKGNTVDKEFYTYVAEFEKEYGNQVWNIPMTFGETRRTELAVCWDYSNGEKEIIFSRTAWDYLEDWQREVVVFHELGHCELGWGHIEYGRSIMNSQPFRAINDEEEYLDNRAQLLDELFRRTPQ